MNLLKETIEDIKAAGKTPEQIAFIGSRESGHECTWAEFQLLADFEYDSGFGAQEVATDLIIVFDDGATMWRREYDGSESWEYSRPFERPKEKHPIRRLYVRSDQCGWETLADVQPMTPNKHYPER